MTIAFKPTATETTIEQNGSAIATLDSTGLTMASGKTIVGSGVGKILQVQSTKMGSAFTTSSTNTWVDITGFSVDITPSSTSSKILIMFDTQLSSDFAGFRIMRNSTEVGSGDVAGSRITASSGGFRPMTGDRVMNVSQVHLDSPATTSAITYKIQTRCNTSGTTYINRTSSWGDSTVYFTNASNITVMEVAG
jgi:hypothetical protein